MVNLQAILQTTYLIIYKANKTQDLVKLKTATKTTGCLTTKITEVRITSRMLIAFHLIVRIMGGEML